MIITEKTLHNSEEPLPDIMKYFAFKHLPDGADKSAGLRKLLEAKDCMVRATL